MKDGKWQFATTGQAEYPVVFCERASSLMMRNVPSVCVAHFVELCCGCAQLSSCMLRLGANILPVDCSSNVHALVVDIEDIDSFSALLQQIVALNAPPGRSLAGFRTGTPCSIE